jgi:CTP synthase
MTKKKHFPKYIFVAGGVMSGIGKGIATASIGRILVDRGFKVTAIKIDPYINVDAGTMNPIEHGEVFVMDDGTECDQDIGNYERFIDVNLTTDNYMTTGRVYQTVIQKERNLEYGGRCVEVVPDIPNEVIRRIKRAQRINKADFVLIEIGGTVGEYQNLLFLEAARMMKLRSPNDVLFVLVSYLPIPSKIGEMKTKPTQYAVRTLNSAGLHADIIIARARAPLDEPRKRKISIFCNIDKKDIISAPDIDSIYEVPINFEKDGLGDRILKKFKLRSRKKNSKEWTSLVKKIKNSKKKKVKIGIVGKYFQTGAFTLMDSYISVIEAIKHASWANNHWPEIHWLSAENYEKDRKNLEELKEFNGIIVPGGFGSRGVEGKILAIEYCRKNKIPFLGLCLGMQLAVVEFARNVARLKDANSTEFNKNCQYPVINVMPEQRNLLKEKKYGGTMRLGAYDCRLQKGTISFQAYKKELISERHRHRYEFNNEFRKLLESKGLVVAGVNPERNLVEIIEVKNHPFFVGTQFHPEFKSRPLRPHPLFVKFIKESIRNLE